MIFFRFWWQILVSSLTTRQEKTLHHRTSYAHAINRANQPTLKASNKILVTSAKKKHILETKYNAQRELRSILKSTCPAAWNLHTKQQDKQEIAHFHSVGRSDMTALYQQNSWFFWRYLWSVDVFSFLAGSIQSLRETESQKTVQTHRQLLIHPILNGQIHCIQYHVLKSLRKVKYL